ncbi:hypothetical protein ACI2OX_10510 [Bacillus sp. N9]
MGVFNKAPKGKTVDHFLTTHYMEEAEICDKVAIIDHGKIIAFDSPNALKRQYTRDQARIISREKQELECLFERNKLNFKIEDGRHIVDIKDFSSFMEIISEHRSAIRDLEMRKGTLNDVFLKITGKNIRGSCSCASLLRYGYEM